MDRLGQLVLNKKKRFLIPPLLGELSALLTMKGASAPIFTVEKSLLAEE